MILDLSIFTADQLCSSEARSVRQCGLGLARGGRGNLDGLLQEQERGLLRSMEDLRSKRLREHWTFAS